MNRMERIKKKLNLLLEYLCSLEKEGFKLVEELNKNYRLVLADGFIPHGHHSENWNYRIHANRTYILKKSEQRYVVIEGIYSFYDASNYEDEKEFPCLVLLELPNGKNYPWEMGCSTTKERDELCKSIKEFYKICEDILERQKPWWLIQSQEEKVP
jgi:hypothetical protein